MGEYETALDTLRGVFNMPGYADAIESHVKTQATRIAKLEQEKAGYFKQAQFYIVEKERAEANLKESDRRLTTHYESATEYRMRWKGAEASAKDWESSYHSEHDSMLREERRADKADAEVEKFHQGFIVQQAEAERLEGELKEQTRLGLACHDELVEYKIKVVVLSGSLEALGCQAAGACTPSGDAKCLVCYALASSTDHDELSQKQTDNSDES